MAEGFSEFLFGFRQIFSGMFGLYRLFFLGRRVLPVCFYAALGPGPAGTGPIDWS